MLWTGTQRARWAGGAAGLWLLLGLLPLAIASGSAGDLDLSFGIGGVEPLALDLNYGDAVLIGVQADGRFVLASQVEGPVVDGIQTASWLVLRRNADGSADPTFGTNGEVRLFGDIRNDRLIDGVLDSNDRILLAGRALVETTTTTTKGKKTRTTTTRLNAFTVARLLPDGTIDTSFGTDGAAHTQIPGASNGGGQAWAVTVQADGKIVAAGEGFSVSTSSGGKGNGKKGGGSTSVSDALVVARYNADGSPDTSFGNGGVTVHDATTEDDGALNGAVGVQSTGDIVVGSFVQGNGDHWVITRYSSSGAVDTGFGRIAPADHRLATLQVDSSDRIVAVGWTNDGSGEDAMLVRYQAGGALDSSFGSGGYASPGFGGPAMGVSAATQPDGKVVMLCAVGDQTAGDLETVPVRFTASGALDGSFGLGGHGEAITSAGERVYPYFRTHIDADGNILVAGLAINSSNGAIFEGFLARWCGG